jgi:hypothetical protein
LRSFFAEKKKKKPYTAAATAAVLKANGKDKLFGGSSTRDLHIYAPQHSSLGSSRNAQGTKQDLALRQSVRAEAFNLIRSLRYLTPLEKFQNQNPGVAFPSSMLSPGTLPASSEDILSVTRDALSQAEYSFGQGSANTSSVAATRHSSYAEAGTDGFEDIDAFMPCSGVGVGSGKARRRSVEVGTGIGIAAAAAGGGVGAGAAVPWAPNLSVKIPLSSSSSGAFSSFRLRPNSAVLSSATPLAAAGATGVIAGTLSGLAGQPGGRSPSVSASLSLSASKSTSALRSPPGGGGPSPSPSGSAAAAARAMRPRPSTAGAAVATAWQQQGGGGSSNGNSRGGGDWGFQEEYSGHRQQLGQPQSQAQAQAQHRPLSGGAAFGHGLSAKLATPTGTARPRTSSGTREEAAVSRGAWGSEKISAAGRPRTASAAVRKASATRRSISGPMSPMKRNDLRNSVFVPELPDTEV